MTKNQKLKTIALFSVLFFLFFAPFVFAARISLDSQIKEIGISSQFRVNIFIDSEGEDINAVDGKIIFPMELLELKKIRDNNSIVNFWVEKPKIISENEIRFSGIIPGGYFGKKGLILSIIFQSKQKGRGLIKISDIKILLNDGKGTEADVVTSNLPFVISKRVAFSNPYFSEKKDIDMPEAFKPIISSNPTIFAAKYFLVFTTQDKGSGIDYYEVCEGKKKCVVAKSPYFLQNQNLDKKIIVKAVDKNGNERIAVLPAQKSQTQYKNYFIFAILLLVAIVMYFIRKILWKK